MAKKYFYAFKVRSEMLKEFLEKAQKGDDMHGNSVETVKDLGDRFLIILSRKYEYPYVINELEKLED